MSDYYVVEVRNLPAPLEEWVSELAFQNGALGVSEILPFRQPEGEEDVTTLVPDVRALDIYLTVPPSTEFLASLQAGAEGAQVRVKAEANRDWLSEWKKGFKPFSLVGSHWVVPSWCERPAEAAHPIWIDPGMAFGTGTHETTQLVAEALFDIGQEQKINELLDMGTGTGILAILAWQLGVTKIRGTEIEPEARRVARENFAANHCAEIELDETQIEDLHNQTYDVVLANIIDGVLVRLQQPLKARVRRGGWLVVSGIISEREKDFLDGFELPPGVQWSQRRQKGDWLCFRARF